MKKCSAALRKRAGAYTTEIFNDCICEVFGFTRDDLADIDAAAYTVRAINKGYSNFLDGEFGTFEEVMAKRDKVELLYQQRILTLTTKQLNEIIAAHNAENGLYRAAKTIESITNELTRRALFHDSNESESKGKDGDVDGPRRPSTKHSQKTTRKRRKTSKDR